jgi:hypothetical protein
MKRRRLYKTFKVDGKDWSIYFASKRNKYLRKDAGGGPYMGRCIHTKHEIYLLDTQSFEQIADTLLHEIIHVSIMEYVLHPEMNEAIVCAITPTTATILTQISPEGFPPPVPKEIL